jgi:hypothetical protein
VIVMNSSTTASPVSRSGRPSGLLPPARRTAGPLSERRLVIAGLLLAQVLVVVLYLVMADNMAQAQRRRLQRVEQARALQRCSSLALREQRLQCRLGLEERQLNVDEDRALLARR